MRKRTQSRECALKVLYQAELTRRDINVASENFWSEYETIDQTVRSFADRLAPISFNVTVMSSFLSFSAVQGVHRTACPP